jgi:repressor LexA
MMLQFPIKGEIIASAPVEYLGEPDPEDIITVDAALLPRRTDNLFALRVRGNSMIDALVAHGDIVLLEKDVEVVNGDMVAAFLLKEQENTLKHFYREGDQVRLQPANQEVEPIYTSAGNLQIQGRVRLVVRQMVRRLH